VYFKLLFWWSQVLNATVIDPKNITNYSRTDNELQTFWLFCIMVAGKNSDTTSRVLSKLLTKISPYDTPFEGIKNLGEQGLYDLLVEHRVGQYDRITKAIWQSLDIDLRNCTREDLMQIYGVSHKTSRFFLLHTREFCEEIVLDTHILSWLREKCGIQDVPKNTPQSASKYEYFADLCKYLMQNHFPGLSLAQIDLFIWTEMSGRLD
jgi:thermostable 8-oxoguanine DNA glycosylase